MIETSIIVGTTAICFLAALIAADRRLGQYLNPPLRAEIETLRSEIKALQSEISDTRKKLNNIALDRGFKDM